MKTLFKIIIVLLMLSSNVFAQKYITKNGKIDFYSDAPMEKIEAKNNQVKAALDAATGDIVFQVLITSFEFPKALMQEHFNENYMESPKFPNSTFKGKIINLKDINFTKNGKYNATIEGDLTIHGVTKKVKQSGTIEVKDGKVITYCKFNILVKDYGINIPNAVAGKIAETVQITVDVALDPKK
ncbi:MAG: YceI family protein [Bacteroidetes bacterium]|nr:YceI family protein [Bacteroidota bacterium]